jgi:hypothetical protein
LPIIVGGQMEIIFFGHPQQVHNVQSNIDETHIVHDMPSVARCFVSVLHGFHMPPLNRILSLQNVLKRGDIEHHLIW